MRSEDAACQTLSGQKLASIRSIHYLSGSSKAMIAKIGALEVETKTGRVVHVSPADNGLCAIGAGPVLPPPNTGGKLERHWSDLTRTIPFAFDNRPIVSKAEPVAHGDKTTGCRIEFATGASFVYQLWDGEARLSCIEVPAATPRPHTPGPKYSLAEVERRWLVAPEMAAQLLSAGPAIVRDRYIADTRIRLRRVTAADAQDVFKLCKKYGNKQGPREFITNIYLSSAEYRLFDQIPGTVVTKFRHTQPTGAIDVYAGPSGPIHVFEVEFSSMDAAAAFAPPTFVAREITEDSTLTGYELALLCAGNAQSGGRE